MHLQCLFIAIVVLNSVDRHPQLNAIWRSSLVTFLKYVIWLRNLSTRILGRCLLLWRWVSLNDSSALTLTYLLYAGRILFVSTLTCLCCAPPSHLTEAMWLRFSWYEAVSLQPHHFLSPGYFSGCPCWIEGCWDSAEEGTSPSKTCSRQAFPLLTAAWNNIKTVVRPQTVCWFPIIDWSIQLSKSSDTPSPADNASKKSLWAGPVLSLHFSYTRGHKK